MSSLEISRASKKFIIENSENHGREINAKYFSSIKDCNENTLSFWNGTSEIKHQLRGTILIGSRTSEADLKDHSNICILRARYDADKVFWASLEMSANLIKETKGKAFNETVFGSKIWATTKIGNDVKIGAGSIIGFEGIATYRDMNNILKSIPHVGSLIIGSRTKISHISD